MIFIALVLLCCLRVIVWKSYFSVDIQIPHFFLTLPEYYSVFISCTVFLLPEKEFLIRKRFSDATYKMRIFLTTCSFYHKATSTVLSSIIDFKSEIIFICLCGWATLNHF